MNLRSLRKAWALLDSRERRLAFFVLLVMLLSAIATAGMVGSIFPFLSVLSDPALIHENELLALAYHRGDFSNTFDFIVALGFGSIFLIVISTVILIINTWVRTRFAQMRVHSISSRLLRNYLTQPYIFFTTRHSGDMSTYILSESDRVVSQFIQPAMTLISSSLTIVAVVGILMLANPLVASITLMVFSSIYALTIFVTRRFVARKGRERAASNVRRYRIAGEALIGIKDVKLLGREAAYADRFVEPSQFCARAQEHLLVVSQAPRFVIQMIGFGGMIALALALLDPDTLSQRDALVGFIPLLGVLAFAGQRLLPELQSVYQSITSMIAGSAALDAVYADFSVEGERPLVSNAPAPLRLTKELQLSEIVYTYPNSERASLDGISLKIRAGERIGVIGSSGAGKTTLADIILGLLIPDRGEISVDGQRIDSQNLRAWQQTIGYVPQDIFLTDASLAENIAFGVEKDEIDRQRIFQAAESAMLHDFAVAELPHGYDTMIGERGVRLSGGQRQRIGIARALYHDADLIVFDEATSALDNITESDVMAAIEALPGDKTVLIIAHRLSTIRHCDRITMLERGKVAAIGSWGQLCKESAAFRSLATVGM